MVFDQEQWRAAPRTCARVDHSYARVVASSKYFRQLMLRTGGGVQVHREGVMIQMDGEVALSE